MQKIAKPGERDWTNKLREMTNISGKDAKKFFGPKFQEIMTDLKLKDDQIRTYVVGKKLGNAPEMPTAPALRDILKEAQKNFNRKEYLACSSELGLFHDQVKKIIEQIKSINYALDEIHHEPLFNNLTPKQREQLLALKSRYARQRQLDFIKEAGVIDSIKDLFANWGKRGRALSAWEKRFPNEVNKFKGGIVTILEKSTSMLDIIIESLKEMATARSISDIDDYILKSAQILKAFLGYEDGKGGFKDFHKTMKPYIEKMEAWQTLQDARPKVDETKPVVTTPGFVMGPNVAPNTGPTAPPEQLSLFQNTGDRPAILPPAPVDARPTLVTPPPNMSEHDFDVTKPSGLELDMPPPPPYKPSPHLEQINDLPLTKSPFANTPDNDVKIKGAHKKFYSSLQALSGESPVMLALFIKKYANSIKFSDPKTAVNLFQISQRIRS